MPEALQEAGWRSGDALAELRRHHAELELLFETMRDLTSTLSSQEVIERLVARALIHLESEIASVLLVEPDQGMRIMHAVGLPDPVVREARLRVGEGVGGWVAAEAQPLLIDDIEADPRFARRNHERYYTHSCISAPLLRGGRAVGVINVNNKRDQSVFLPTDLRLLEALAGHASVALGNARRFEDALHRAQRDALTGLANHGHFWSSVDTELQRASRYERELSLVMIDVDGFKRFNDRFGHLSGDEALVSVAHMLTDRSRVHDVAGRYGGDEFAVLLPETALEGATVFAEKVRASVEALEIGAREGSEPLTVSAGVACLAETGASTTSELIAAADAHLYEAKKAGRNRVQPRPPA